MKCSPAILTACFIWRQDVRAIIVEAEVRCLMLSAQELTAVAAVIKDCTCVRAVVVMDRYRPEHVWIP